MRGIVVVALWFLPAIVCGADYVIEGHESIGLAGLAAFLGAGWSLFLLVVSYSASNQ